MQPKRLLMISTDRTIFKENSTVRLRMAEYSKKWDELHIIVFAQSKYKFKEISISSNCWVYPTNSFFNLKYSFDAIRLGQFIIPRRKISNITCQDPFLTAMAGISLKKRYNIPLEIQLHTDISSPNYAKTIGNKIRKALALSYLPKADSVRVVSNRSRDYMVNTLGIDQAKIEVRPVVVDTEWIRNASVLEGADLHKKYPQFEKIVLMASRFEKEKNIELAINSFAEVLRNLSKAGMVIVGDGSEISKLKSQISRLGLGSSIIIEPWVNREILVSYYKTADLFLNTSFFEGYGMTLVEANAAGCKIVSTDVGVAREVGAVIVGYNTCEVAKVIYDCLH